MSTEHEDIYRAVRTAVGSGLSADEFMRIARESWALVVRENLKRDMETFDTKSTKPLIRAEGRY